MQNKTTIFQKSFLKRKLPYNFDEHNSVFAFFNELPIQTTPEINVHSFKDVRVDSDSVIYNDKREILFEIFEFCLKKKYEKILLNEKLNFKNLRYPRRFLRSFIKKTKNKLVDLKLLPETHIKQKCILFTDDRVNNNFYHWMTDALIRLLALEDIPKNSMLLLPQECWAHSYVKDSLKVFNIGIEKICFIPTGKEVRIQDLQVVSCSILATGSCNHLLIPQLKKKLKNFYSTKLNLDLGDKLYISRQKSKGRKAKNEDLVVKLLVSYGFKIICAEDYSLVEQISIMQRAKYLVSVTGAGLTHMMFMQEGGFVLELIHENFICPTKTIWPGGYTDAYSGTYYYSLANIFNINYLYQTCPRTYDCDFLLGDNIAVDIPALEKNINLMLHKQ